MRNDRRLYSPAPNLNVPENFSKLPVRICLGSAIGLLMALVLFIRITGPHVLYIHYWAYMAVAAVILLLLLSAGALGAWHRVKGENARKYTAIALVCVLVVLALGAFFFCSSVATSYLVPVAYSHSPNGENSIVIMKTDMEDGSSYSAYPLSGCFFLAAATSEEVYSEMGVERVEWEGENVARVYLTDMEGKEAFITVDYTEISGMDAEPQAAE